MNKMGIGYLNKLSGTISESITKTSEYIKELEDKNKVSKELEELNEKLQETHMEIYNYIKGNEN